MLNYYFGVPFADGGDKAAIPSATQPDGSMSMTQGFGPNYELPYSDPNSKDIPRDKSNQLSWLITKALQEYQQNGVPDWIDPSQNGGVNFAYPNAARVRYSNGKIYVSQKAANNSLPTVPTDWFEETGRLLRTSTYRLVAGVQNVSVDGGANTTVGAGTFTALLATKKIRARVQGGGSSGGGAAATAAGQYAAGLGGQGGAYGEGVFTSAFASLVITVGAGGAAPAAGNTAGIAGGTSSAGALLTAPGGAAPAAAGPANPLGNGSVVDFTPSAMPTGANVIARTGAGGGLRFFLSTGQFIGSRGGAAGDGGDGPPMQNNGAGLSATNPGAGGSAATNGAGLPAAAGGAGGDGYVIIEEFA